MSVQTKERLPDWTLEEFERYRMNQLTQALERRFLGIEEELNLIGSSNQGLLDNGVFAPLEHSHGETEILDLGQGDFYVSLNYIATALRLGDLWDVNTDGVAESNVIVWESAQLNGKGGWKIADLSTITGSLAGLVDTTITAPIVDGSIIIYDGITNKWINADSATLPYVLKAGDTMEGNLNFDLHQATFGDTFQGRIKYDATWQFINSVSGGAIDFYVNETERQLRLSNVGPVELGYSGDTRISTTMLGGLIDGTLLDVDAGADATVNANVRNSLGGITVQTANSTGDMQINQTGAAGVFERKLLSFVRNGIATMHWNDEPRISTNGIGEARMIGDINIGSDTSGSPRSTVTFYDSDESHLLGFFGFGTSTPNIFEIVNRRHGGNLNLIGQNAAGTDTTFISCDPDLAVSAYYDEGAAGGLAFRTGGHGIDAIQNSGATPRVDIYNSSLVRVASIEASPSAMNIEYEVDGQEMFLQVNNIGGAQRTGMQIDPDSFVRLYHPGSNTVTMDTLADGIVVYGTGMVQIPDGTTAQEPTPANGMIRYNTDTASLSAVIGGAWADVMSVLDSVGDLSDVDITGAADNDLLFRSGGNWIDTAGNVTWDGSFLEALATISGDPGVEGGSIQINNVTYEASAKVSDIGGANEAQLLVHRHSTTLPALILGTRSKSDTSSHIVVADNDILMTMLAAGYDGIDTYSLSSEIRFEVDGTPGDNDMPGQLTFMTAADGTQTPVERMRIRADGTVEIDNDLNLAGNLIGVGGGNTGIGEYTYESTITAPPLTGEVRFNNASIASATEMYVFDTNADSVDVSNFLALLDDGAVIFINARDNRDAWVAVELSSATDNTTYWTFGIQAIDVGPTALVDADPIDFLFALAGGGGGGSPFTEIVITNSNVIDLVDTDVALNLGAADPDVGPHLELGLFNTGAGIQAKANNTTVDDLFIGGLGGTTFVGPPSTAAVSGGFSLRHANGAAAGGAIIESTISGIILEGRVGSNTILDFHAVNGNLGARQVYNGSRLQWDGFADGTDFEFQANDAGSVPRQLLHMDPDTDIEIYHPPSAAVVIETHTPATGGAFVNNTLTGAGLERVLTVGDLGGLDDLNDVTLTSPATGGLLYKSAGDWLDVADIIIDPGVDITFAADTYSDSNIMHRDTIAVLGSDFTTVSATHAIVTGLNIPDRVVGRYLLEYVLVCTCDVAGKDIIFDIIEVGGTQTGSAIWQYTHTTETTVHDVKDILTDDFLADLLASASKCIVKCSALVNVTAGPVTFELRARQSVADAGNSSNILAGSICRSTRIL